MTRLILLILILAVSPRTALRAQSALQRTSRCVQVNGKLVTVPVNYNTATGEYTVTANGEEKPFDEMYPTNHTYAANATWFIAGDTIAVKWQKFRKKGLPRTLGATTIRKWGEYEDVPVYAENPALTFQKVIYLPVRTECEFQPYEWVESAMAAPTRAGTKKRR